VTDKVVGSDGEWRIAQDNEVAGSYLTKEAAFEAAVSAASNAIKKGYGVQLEVPEAARRSYDWLSSRGLRAGIFGFCTV
jgi:viroplasmin and RNaseH domain-containing protein